MSVDIVDILDALVEPVIFMSRSEAVDALIMRAINSRKVLFDEISRQAKDIPKKREAARRFAQQTIWTLKPDFESDE